MRVSVRRVLREDRADERVQHARPTPAAPAAGPALAAALRADSLHHLRVQCRQCAVDRAALLLRRPRLRKHSLGGWALGCGRSGALLAGGSSLAGRCGRGLQLDQGRLRLDGGRLGLDVGLLGLHDNLLLHGGFGLDLELDGSDAGLHRFESLRGVPTTRSLPGSFNLAPMF